MRRENLVAAIAAIVAVVAVALGAFGLYRATTTQRDLVAMQATTEASSAQTQSF